MLLRLLVRAETGGKPTPVPVTWVRLGSVGK